MIDSQTLLRHAARCRRMAGMCSTVAVARKFEALAHDYEEHARLLQKRGGAANERSLTSAPQSTEIKLENDLFALPVPR